MRTFSLDMIPGGAQTAVACNQYEAGDTWVFALYYDGGRYSIPQDAAVSITGTKPDGAAYKIAGTVVDNAVVITVTDQITACEGRSIAEILVESETDGTTLYSANFPLLVEPAAVQGDLSPSEIPAAIVDADGNVYLSTEYGAGLSEEVKQALLNCFKHVVWLDGHEDYYDALYDALYPRVDVSRISAVFTQGDMVVDEHSSTLDDLRNHLVVMAYYTDGTSKVLTVYSLSGTLSVGTSIITVTALGQTDTFTVEVSKDQRIAYEMEPETVMNADTMYATGVSVPANTEDFTVVISAKFDKNTAGDSDRFILGWGGLNHDTRAVIRLGADYSEDGWHFVSNYLYADSYINDSGKSATTDYEVIWILRNASATVTKAFTCDGQILQKKTESAAEMTRSRGGNMAAGGKGTSEPTFRGTVHMFRIYNTALTNSEIEDLVGVSLD